MRLGTSRAVLDELALFRRYLVALRRLLRRPVTLDDCRRQIRERYERREDGLFVLLEHGVYGNPRSPYLPLLRRAGAELGDVRALVADKGLDAALESLRDAGVYISLEEFKGRRPIRRGELELPVRPADFDNPLAVGFFRGQSGGSRGTGRAVLVDTGRLAYDSMHHGVFLDAFDLWPRPTFVWYPAPPVITGLLNVLNNARLGRDVEAWYSQSAARAGGAKAVALALAAWWAGRAASRRVPYPRHVAPSDGLRVARRLAVARASGTQALLQCTPSSGVRVCAAAADHGLDISGTFFRFGGEPYTPAKAKIVHEAGCDAACNYFMTEVGVLGTACADAAAPDDVHLALDKVAVTQHERRLEGGATVPLISYTTLHAGATRVMLNVESDDFGVLERRNCGCAVGRLGLDLHLYTIRSFEKLTGEGTTFLGVDLIRLVEEVLPRRFGGGAADYQLVEVERDGLTRVQVVVSPRVGPVEEGAIVGAVLDSLRASAGDARVMADAWASAGTLEVVRREPYVTAGSKVLALHVLER